MDWTEILAKGFLEVKEKSSARVERFLLTQRSLLRLHLMCGGVIYCGQEELRGILGPGNRFRSGDRAILFAQSESAL
jgi:hypothetical protein